MEDVGFRIRPGSAPPLLLILLGGEPDQAASPEKSPSFLRVEADELVQGFEATPRRRTEAFEERGPPEFAEALDQVGDEAGEIGPREGFPFELVEEP